MSTGTVIHMRNIPAKADGWRALDHPLECPMWPGWEGAEEVPQDFEWNGHSSGILSPMWPKWNHPISSCRHDWRCQNAKNAKQRKWADEQFRVDVGTTSWWITKQVGYLGVRAGAMLGIGSSY